MICIRFGIVTGMIMGLISCQAHALTISDVHISKAVFHPDQNETTDIQFNMDHPAMVELQIYDGRDVLVRRIKKPMEKTGVISWDGRNDLDNIVPAEAYHYVLHASTESGDEATYDLTDITGGERISTRDIKWNPEDQKISYFLPKPARVAIRIGLKNHGPLLRTLRDWVPRLDGPNQEYWDGMDTSEVLNLAGHPDLNIHVEAYALSENTLFVGNPPDKIGFVDVSTEQRIVRDATDRSEKLMYHHSHQPLESRGDISIRLELPEGLPRDEENLPIVSGRVPVRLQVERGDRQRAVERRFEPVFFIDGTFTFENEVGYLPFTWIWDATRTGPGIHYVTANLRGYEGNFGIATRKVRVVREE